MWRECSEGPAACAELSLEPEMNKTCLAGCYCPNGTVLLVSEAEGLREMSLAVSMPSKCPGWERLFCSQLRELFTAQLSRLALRDAFQF